MSHRASIVSPSSTRGQTVIEKIPSEESAKPVDPKLVKYPLLVKNISCMGLSNVEILGGKNDPYVLLSFGRLKEKTKVIEEAGTNASWDLSQTPLKFDISESEIRETTLLVSVFDHNNIRSDVLIGEATVSLVSLLTDAHSKDIKFDDIQLLNTHVIDPAYAHYAYKPRFTPISYRENLPDK